MLLPTITVIEHVQLVSSKIPRHRKGVHLIIKRAFSSTAINKTIKTSFQSLTVYE